MSASEQSPATQGKERAVASETRLVAWDAVLTASTQPPHVFHVLSRAPAGNRLRIKNTDGTTTSIEGYGLELAGPEPDGLGRGARFTAGTVTSVQRIDRSGNELEAFDGFEIPATDDAYCAGSFSAPPGGARILAWIGTLARDHTTAEAAGGTADMAADAADGEAASPASHAQAPEAKSDSAAGNVALNVLKFLFAPEIRTRTSSGESGADESEATRQKKRLPKIAWIVPLGLAAAALAATAFSIDPAERDRQQLKWALAQPGSIPYPADNIPSAAKNELGRRLFAEGRLSADNTVSCATCHNPTLSFADGVQFGQGVSKRPLPMHSPSLWNMAWGHAFFWDGRAATLEEQVRGPTSNPDEMGQNLEIGATKLAADQTYSTAFAAAFPDAPEVSGTNIAKAIASYQRTLISPSTRFDRWMQGDARALSKAERNGFHLFVGKGGCINCHSGWAFTDHAFHDIGLPGTTPGRGRVIKRPALDRAFKTPSLRELVWTAPYMHDGSLATLEAVVSHYESGGVDRPTRSPDLPRKLDLSQGERTDLVAFLKSLSSDRAPHLVVDTVAVKSGSQPAVPPVTRVGQRNKAFAPDRIRIKAGETIEVVNDDNQPHNVFVTDPRMTFDSGWQEPGTQTLVPFAQAGDFELFCGIHPNMRLKVEVVPTVIAK